MSQIETIYNAVLEGDADGHLQKPELHYEDFVAALAGAGLNAAAQPAWQDHPMPV